MVLVLFLGDLSRLVSCVVRSNITTRPLVCSGLSDIKERSGHTAIIDKIEEIAGKKKVSMAEVAIAWMFSNNDFVCAPLVGIRTTERLDELNKRDELAPDQGGTLGDQRVVKPVAIRGHS